MNARGRVALLRPRLAILGQPLLDQRHPRIGLRRPRPPDWWPERQVAHLEVLAHGRLAHMQLARYRRDRAAFLSHRTDRVDNGHADHCLPGLSTGRIKVPPSQTDPTVMVGMLPCTNPKKLRDYNLNS